MTKTFAYNYSAHDTFVCIASAGCSFAAAFTALIIAFAAVVAGC